MTVRQDKKITEFTAGYIAHCGFTGIERRTLEYLNTVSVSVPTDPDYRECAGSVEDAAAALEVSRGTLQDMLRSLEDRNIYYLDSDPDRLGLLRLLPHVTHYLRPNINNEVPGYREILEYVRSSYDLDGIRKQWQ